VCSSDLYTDEQSTVIQEQPVEIATRVNKPHVEAPDAEETVIQFIPNPSMTKH